MREAAAPVILLVMGPGIAFAAALAALIIQSAPSSEATALRPIGPWVVNYADNMCVLSRQFGAGEGEITLIFRPGPMSDHLRIGLMTKGGSKKVAWGRAALNLDAISPIDAYYDTGPALVKGYNVILIDTNRSKLATLNLAKQLQIKADKTTFSFALAGMTPAIKALTACETDLLRLWGMDAATIASIATAPQLDGELRRFFSTDDYPMEAIRNGEQGIAGIRFMVGIDGRANDCKIVESSGSRLIDQKTCQIAESRFRLRPARTHDGSPIASLSYARVRWELPDM